MPSRTTLRRYTLLLATRRVTRKQMAERFGCSTAVTFDWIPKLGIGGGPPKGTPQAKKPEPEPAMSEREARSIARRQREAVKRQELLLEMGAR
jgi:hypothetical protein